MNAMLVGADTLGNIPGVLGDFGITVHRHVTGRNRSDQRKLDRLPNGTELVILFTDFLGHNVMRHFRELAHSENIRFIACRRSVCALKKSLEDCGLGEDSGDCSSCPNNTRNNSSKKRH